MSAIGALLARALGSLGGPAMAGAIVVGGIVVGALGGGFIAASSGGSQPATSGGRLPIYACPESGDPLLMVPAGQKLLATGRTEDGAWLRIHFPDPGRSEAWIQASPVQVDGAVDALPVAECLPEMAVAPPLVAPAESFTVAANNPPSAAPTEVPTATPAPTPTPPPTEEPNAKPTLSALTVSTRKISYDTDDYCPNAETSVTFRVRAGDDEGVTGVTLFWREPGAGSFARAAMTRSAGSTTSGTWQVTLDTTANGITKAGRLSYYAVATDADGATRRIPTSGSSSITVAVCANTGPTITNAKSLSGSTLAWDPEFAGRCQTATNLTASVKDVDGVKSVTLFYRRPGDRDWQSKRMNETSAGKWFENLDTLGDGREWNWIPNPPTGTLRWYIKAVDDKGKSSQTSTREVTVRRCDTEAKFGGSSTYPARMCSSSPTWFYGSADDPDGINGSSAVLVYTYVLNDGSKKTARKRMTGGRDGQWYYQVSLQPGADWSLRAAPLTFYIETSDRYRNTRTRDNRYDGLSTGGSGKTTVSKC